MENIIQIKSFEFAKSIIVSCDKLEKDKKYNIANQLFKSGTSIGANVREAQGAESKIDFIHKHKIAYKETEETEYWLMLCDFSKGYPIPQQLLTDVIELKRILVKIITTSKK